MDNSRIAALRKWVRDQPRTVRIMARITREEAAWLLRAAREARCSVSAFVRALIREEKQKWESSKHLP